MTLGWVLLALVYLTGLFWIARWGDRNTPVARAITSHPIIYSLALAIYCSAWTFFGMVGEASRNQWQYLRARHDGGGKGSRPDPGQTAPASRTNRVFPTLVG